MSQKKIHRDDYIDVEDFVESIDDELEDFDDIEREPCPRCGSVTWTELNINSKTGKPSRCNECRSARIN